MPYYRSNAKRISQGFQKVHICYFTIFLWITMHFQSSSRNLLKQKKKENTSASGTLSFPRIIPQSRNESWLHIWNPEVYSISTRGPCLLLPTDTKGTESGRSRTENGEAWLQSTGAWCRQEKGRPGPDHGQPWPCPARAQHAAAATSCARRPWRTWLWAAGRAPSRRREGQRKWGRVDEGVRSASGLSSAVQIAAARARWRCHPWWDKLCCMVTT